MLTITVVGLGPWGLCLLERLVSTLREQTRPGPVAVHVVEPGLPGAGVFDVRQPDYLILNTPAGQHSMYPLPVPGPAPSYGLDFLGWLTREGYRWVGDGCARDPAGRPIGAHDFVPRRLLGEYLNWFYRELVGACPPGLTISWHRCAAVDIRAGRDGERVCLADGTSIVSDHVVLATGHTPTLAPPGRAGGVLVAPYPVAGYLTRLSAGCSVGVAGLGLVALDVLTALTLGRGGRYLARGDRLRYRPSGREPLVSLFSPSGEAYCAKAPALADPTGDYQPVICTEQAVLALRGGPDRGRQLDARGELLPLVFAEMQVRFHQQSAQLRDGAVAATAVRRELGVAWAAGGFEASVARLAARDGTFEPAAHFFTAADREFASAKDYEEHVYAAVARDLDEALVPGGASPVKAAYEVLRVLRDTMRTAIEFRGLTLASYRDFRANIRGRVNRLVAGPPAVRAQQLLALLDAGVARFPVGPSPQLEVAADGHPQLRSTRLANPQLERLDLLVQGHLDDPSVVASGSRLLVSLHASGRLCELGYGDTVVGGLALSAQLHPINADGAPQPRLWVLGAMSEGARYFTHYVPSPRSRLRAFFDAQRCVAAMLGAAAA